MNMIFSVLRTKTILLCAVCFFSFFYSACEKEESVPEEQPNPPDIQTEIDYILPNLNFEISENNQLVVILLGYGYNSGDSYKTLVEKLTATYGLAENDGIIIPFVYPDDFMSFGYERISLFPEKVIEELEKYPAKTLAGLITLGAPEGTHRALASFQDTQTMPCVFSVFSQDDILGTEAGSDIVIDYSVIKAEDEESFAPEELGLSYPDDVFEIIEPLINATLDWEHIKNTGLFVPALRAEFFKRIDCDFFVYIDPQTGLRAQNHYVLTDTQKRYHE